MAPRSTDQRPPLRALRRVAALALLAAPLAACQSDGMTTGSTYPDDYRLRHPIALVNAPTDLDLFVGRNAPGLDPRQAQDLRQFVADYRMHGQGPIMMFVPSPGAGRSHQGAAAVRSGLAANGVPHGLVRSTTYEAPAGEIASPVRLSYTKLQAKVMTQCGNFNQDITGTGATLQGWQNKPYFNAGCAYQTAIAAQVEDPLDLQRPRAETRPDVLRRMKVFDDARKGTDPSTQWKSEAASVANSVATGGN
ncbi:CpaD family pilus assembly protein [Alsobacter sp. R-9]